MPKRGPKRQRVRLPANSRTGSKSRACHFGAVEIDAGWPAKCIVLIGTGRRVLEQEKQVTNWINSGGHAPPTGIGNSDRHAIGRHRTGCWKKSMIIGGVLLT